MKSAFDADVREAMGETVFPYTIGNGNKNVSSLSRSVFLLSVTELGLPESYGNVEGSALPIASTLKVAYLDGVATTYLTRSPHTGGTTYVCSVYGADTAYPAGGLTFSNCYDSEGIRPCFTLHESCTVLEEVNTDGSYTLSLGDDAPDDKQYFKLTVIDGTEKPTNPAENTIWVNTDVDMGHCYLAPNAPTSPAVGDVWVNTATVSSGGSNTSDNLLRVNDNPYLEINVASIFQWDGSSWVNKESSGIYANGGWKLFALYLINYGEANPSYAYKGGAYTSFGNAVYIDNEKPGSNFSKVEPTFSTNGLYFSTPFDGGQDIYKNVVVMTTTPVNFANYNKYKCVVSVSGYSKKTLYVGVYTTANANIYDAPTTVYSMTNANGTYTVDADVTSWNTEYYPAVKMTNGSSQSIAVTVHYWCFTA